MKVRKIKIFKKKGGGGTGENRMAGFYVVKGITTHDTRNLACVWKNRWDRGDEGRLVLMRKIEMSAITDHWLQTRVNISKWILAVAQKKQHTQHTHRQTHKPEQTQN